MPTYKNLSPVDAAHLQVCEECGASVSDVEKHDGWHGQVLRRVFDPVIHDVDRLVSDLYLENSSFAAPVFGSANEFGA